MASSRSQGTLVKVAGFNVADLLAATIRVLLLILPLSLASGVAMGSLRQMTDGQLSKVTGQALFVADKVNPSGSGTGASPTDFTYYRVGLDAKLQMNMNIDKLALGCGGVNERLAANSCDVNMDFVSFLGHDTTNTALPGAVGSDFTLLRPYIEIAVQNDTSPTQRQVVGIKIGAQSADGYVGIGRVYQNGQVNQENGGTCNTGATSGAGALACNSGLNTVSGYLHTDMSASMPMTVCTLGITNGNCLGGSTSTVCFGAVSFDGNCNTPYYVDATGTRMSSIDKQGIPLKINGGLASLFGSGYAWITENLRFIHGFSLVNTNDFFLSFQRQAVAYPKYDRSGYAVSTNTGWWMNVPYVQVRDIHGPHLTLTLGDAISALGTPGYHLTDANLNTSPPDNCYGSAVFC